ncbi:MAG: polysaccharide biosynthesis tyrosine autokinase [Zoogloeaceae bacterium]|nr:polysaccharide biosynthesis tyrosine autokinase [Zoogloeaceae bacterium]
MKRVATLANAAERSAVEVSGASPPSPSPTIGRILEDSGRLSGADVERILADQAARGGEFGAVGLRLGLLAPQDIQFALARQYRYEYLSDTAQAPAPELVSAFQPFSPVAEALRHLRSQLTLRWLRPAATPPCLAITGIGRGDGRSFIAANLAVMFAQTGLQTLLVDADLRAPALHRLFRVDNRLGLSSLLAGRGAGEAVVRIAGLSALCVLPSGPVPPNPQELLSQPLLADQFRALEQHFQVLIVDSSAAASGADAEFVASAAGAALIVTRQDITPLADVQAFHGALQAIGIPVLGAVVNQ